jgi:hypothetical protein
MVFLIEVSIASLKAFKRTYQDSPGLSRGVGQNESLFL